VTARSSEVAEFLAGAVLGPAHVVTEDDLADLPDPVRRYLQVAGVVGTAVPATVRIRQQGAIRQGPSRRWSPFVAEEYFTTRPAGFMWVAKARTSPFLTATVVDRYQSGTGRMTVRLLGRLTVADDGSPEMNASSLVRYLNEAMWFPAALAVAPIQWTAINDTTARAFIRDGDLTASGTCFFDDAGRLTNFVAERYRQAGRSQPKLQEWSTPILRYGTMAGLNLPVAGEAMWTLDRDEFAYVRMRVEEIEYDRPEPF
jgi:hypothetical protein